jgi:hypothetical protein
MLEGHANAPLSFVESVTSALKRVDYRRAITEDDLDNIRRLRYDAYMKEGAISANLEGKLCDRFDDGSNVYNFGIYVDGELTSALRLHVITPEQRLSPALESFPDFLERELDAGKTIIDPNRFVANYALARTFPELPYVTLRLAYMAASYFEADAVTATVRKEHQAFYRRALRMTPVCAPRPYPMLSKPIGLMLIDFPQEREHIVRRHPFYLASELECSRSFGPRRAKPSIRTVAKWAHADELMAAG